MVTWISRIVLLSLLIGLVHIDFRFLYVIIGLVIYGYIFLRKDINEVDLKDKIRQLKDYNSQLKKDKRQYLLYLRGFKIDNKNSVDGFFDFYVYIRLTHLYTNDKLTIEEKIVKKFKIAGPVIAIMNPKESNYLGATKYNIKRNNWQNNILKKIYLSKLILLIPDLTPGILWEMEQIVKHRFIDKLVIILVYGEDGHFLIQKHRHNKFKDIILSTFNITIPEYDPKKIYLVFDNDSNCVLLNTPMEVLRLKNIL
jgi:hypothetical protein